LNSRGEASINEKGGHPAALDFHTLTEARAIIERRRRRYDAGHSRSWLNQ
jgi:hypothetical protein